MNRQLHNNFVFIKYTSCLFQYALMVIILLALCITQCQAKNTWAVSISEDDGLPLITKGGGSILNSSFDFYGNNWKWTSLDLDFKAIGQNKYSLVGSNKALDFNLDANITKTNTQQLTWDIQFNTKSTQKDVIGGGITFKFDTNNLENDLGEPEILSDKSGWSWGKAEKRIEMRFKPKPASLYFERNSKKELRAYFFSDIIPAGKTQYIVTLNIPANMAILPTIAERFGNSDTTKWTKNMVDWKTSPVDLSFLNASERPAGKRGFIKAKGEQLVFEDGKVAKFWGTNISAYTVFGTPKENVKLQAKRLSELGFNLVRIHHIDSSWVNPNIFGNHSSDTKSINEDAIEKIDWWIKCLKDEGIYVWLDLHVERRFKADDGITAFDEIAKGKSDVNLKGYNYVNLSMQKAMREFNAAYVGHINPYTRLKYADEPAIIAMLITNENDVTNHFGTSLQPDKNVAYHSKLYMDASDRFAKTNLLSKEATWRAWEHGPSKLFLNDLEYQFNLDMIKHLRSLGVKVPIVTTSSWGGNPLSALPALSSGDIIDAHAYQPFGALESNPLFTSNLAHWLAASQVVGKPMSVTEWNAEPFPSPDRHTLPLYVASQASAQGWDAMMQYAYSQEPLKEPNKWEGKPSNWHAYNDPATLATMPAAALMYRRGDVQEAKSTYVLNAGSDIFNQYISPNNSAFIRTATELGKLQIAMPSVKELPWLQKSTIPTSAKISDNPSNALIKNQASETISDNNELLRNWEKGYSTINSDYTQAAIGWIGGEKLLLNDVEFTAITRNASIAVQSLDKSPINQSKYIFISLAARALPTNQKLPYLSEPVEGQLQIKAPKGLKLFKLDENQILKNIPTTYNSGWYKINLDKSLETYWLFLSDKK